tara:strand:- start:13651 stop:13899 length:249 start_codon:yes stop_codon:yes gene_type:complete
MIKFANDFEEFSSQSELKKILNEILDTMGDYPKGSVHGGLSPVAIEKIIAYIMYSENCDSLDLNITKADDEYHLNLTIKDKQ